MTNDKAPHHKASEETKNSAERSLCAKREPRINICPYIPATKEVYPCYGPSFWYSGSPTSDCVVTNRQAFGSFGFIVISRAKFTQL